jgi:dTDP-L-rhamnose 4-epimerase
VIVPAESQLRSLLQDLEPMRLDDEYINPVTTYELTKYSQELIAMQVGRQMGIPAAALRDSITQGSYEDGLRRRDYIHIDVVDANLLATDDPRTDYQAYNVGTGKTTAVLAYAQLLVTQMRGDIEPEISGAYQVGDVRHTVPGTSKIGRRGWKPARQLPEIFADYLAWLNTAGDTADYFTPT